MSGTIKRLDLQLGSFACSVQGFDDPVQPVQQVLQALQNLLEETPETAGLGIAFDADEIDRLIGEVARRADLDEENVEIVPGLIIVHRGNAPGAAEQDSEDSADSDGGTAWSPPFSATYDDAGEEAGEEADQDADIDAAATGEDAEPGYVNIFAPAAATNAETDSSLFATATDDTPEADQPIEDEISFAARLRQAGTEAGTEEADPYVETDEETADAPVRDIFADPGEGTGGSIFADPMAANIAAEPVEGDSPVNFFASSDDAESDAEDAGDEILNLATSRNIFNSDTLKEMNPDPEDERGEALFGRSDDQPEVEEANEGYTAAGLAETAGAESVAELMVTAAAWMVLIQGQTTFSRRDVIAVFEGIPGEHSKTLEARIKGFGKAVRDGQLIMVEDGVFGLSRTELDRFQGLL